MALQWVKIQDNCVPPGDPDCDCPPPVSEPEYEGQQVSTDCGGSSSSSSSPSSSESTSESTSVTCSQICDWTWHSSGENWTVALPCETLGEPDCSCVEPDFPGEYDGQQAQTPCTPKY